MQLQFRDLSYGYDRMLFDCISGSVQSGEVLNILGTNGAGKTTFARCLLNIVRNYSGSILYDGIDIKTATIREHAKKIGYIGSIEDISKQISVFDYVLLGCATQLNLLKMPQKNETDLAKAKLTQMGCEHLMNKKMSELSQGEKQLVSIAKILVQNPEVIIFDEPTASLDLGNQNKLLRLIKSLTLDNHIVINITHNPNHAFYLGGYVLLLSQKGYLFGEVDEMMTQSNLSELYEANIKIIKDQDAGKIAISM